MCTHIKLDLSAGERIFFSFIQFFQCTVKSRKTCHPQFRDTRLTSLLDPPQTLICYIALVKSLSVTFVNYSLNLELWCIFRVVHYQVIMELLAGDQVYVIADGYITDVETNVCQADGYTSFTGLQIRSGLE